MARIWFAHPVKDSYSSTCCCDELKSLKQKHAVVAQLVEHHLAKVDVASSSLVNRSTEAPRFASGLFCCLRKFWFWRRGLRKLLERAESGSLRMEPELPFLSYPPLDVLQESKNLQKNLVPRSCGGGVEIAL